MVVIGWDFASAVAILLRIAVADGGHLNKCLLLLLLPSALASANCAAAAAMAAINKSQ